MSPSLWSATPAAGVALGVLLGCGSSEPAPADPECRPPQFRACEAACGRGVQYCVETESGSYWSACACVVLDAGFPPPDDGGAGGAAGAAGTAGAAGAAGAAGVAGAAGAAGAPDAGGHGGLANADAGGAGGTAGAAGGWDSGGVAGDGGRAGGASGNEATDGGGEAS